MISVSIRPEVLQELKEKYPEGTRVLLLHACGRDDMPRGLKGTVQSVDDSGAVHVLWANGKELPMLHGFDEICVAEE